MLHLRTKFAAALSFVFLAGLTFASPQQNTPATNPSVETARLKLSSYTLGAGDEITLTAVGIDELPKQPVRINNDGEINIAFVGRVRAAGLKIDQLEKELEERLKKYFLEPHVVVGVTRVNSQPMSVLGSVARPNTYQLEGEKTLIEMLSQAGGMNEQAGTLVRVSRQKEWGSIPLASAKVDGNQSVVEIDYKTLVNGSVPENNIKILPYDVIFVPKAPIVYVMGEVRTPGAFTLNDRKSVSLVELLGRVGGTLPTAQTKQARVIRPVPDGSRIEQVVNLSDVLKGKQKDLTLEGDDILWVPNSEVKSTLRKTFDQVIGTTLGIAVYRF